MARAWVLMVFLTMGVVHAQVDTTGVKCFTVEQQKRILKKFVDLDECTALRKVDSAQIALLDTALVKSFAQQLVYIDKINHYHHVADELDKKVRVKNKIIFGSIATNLLLFLLLLF
jgi:predicted nucleotidyltransferase